MLEENRRLTASADALATVQAWCCGRVGKPPAASFKRLSEICKAHKQAHAILRIVEKFERANVRDQ